MLVKNTRKTIFLFSASRLFDKKSLDLVIFSLFGNGLYKGLFRYAFAMRSDMKRNAI